MKLPIDQNISPRLALKLQDEFPNSEHVQTTGLGSATNDAIWMHAKQNQFCILTKDVDFSERSAIFKSPPKVIWIRLGNCTTGDIEQLLRRNIIAILDFENRGDLDVLSLF